MKHFSVARSLSLLSLALPLAVALPNIAARQCSDSSSASAPSSSASISSIAPPPPPATSTAPPPSTTTTTTTAPTPTRSSALQPLKYNHLPLGFIQPAGWMLDQLNLQANGLAGNEADFYSFVAQSNWTGGDQSYSNLNEGGSYWFNGMVANAFVLHDQRLIGQVQNFLDYIIQNQASDGWIGPEPRTLWGRYPVLLGMMQFAEADPTQTDTIVGSMLKFVQLAHDMMQNNGTGIEEWGAARYQDFELVVQWLYDFYPNGQDDMLVDTMKLLKQTGTDWRPIFDPANFPTGDTGTDGRVTWHGVNIGQALKAGVVDFRVTQDATDAASVPDWWDILYQYHGRPHGVFGADEHLAGLSPTRGTELCTVVETMYSGSYVFQATGNNTIADLVERMAYNALPATLTGDMWAHQYLQQLNQINSKHLSPNPFATDGDYSNVFGLAPNYPCCTVNHPQGWPKFVSNAFVTTQDNSGLVQVYLGPFAAQTTLAGGNAVNVTVDTQYPFSDTLTVNINAGSAYTHYVRIPEWAKSTGKGSVTINGQSADFTVNDDSLLAIPAGAGTTAVVINLPSDITTSAGPTGGIHVQRGPLLWASDLFHTTQVLATDPNQGKAQDFEYDLTAGFNYAIDPSTLTFKPSTSNGTLPSPVFDSQIPPIQITANACPVDWSANGDIANDPPSSPAACTGSSFEFIFWPYGACKLRIAELPTMQTS